jgi:hypothetical protein
MSFRVTPFRLLQAAFAAVAGLLLLCPVLSRAEPPPGWVPPVPTVHEATQGSRPPNRKPPSKLSLAEKESPPLRRPGDKTLDRLWDIPSDHTPTASGKVLVVHVFVNDPNDKWKDAIDLWDNDRDDMAELAKDGCDFIADKAPSAAHLQFSNHGNPYDWYSYETTIDEQIPEGSDAGYSWTDSAAVKLGFQDWNNNGTVIDDIIDGMLYYYPQYEWGLVLFHPFRSGRSFAYKPESWAVLYAEDQGSGNIDSPVFSHEIIHLFGADDEYKEGGVCPQHQCHENTHHDWLAELYLNGNCAACSDHDKNCIMRDTDLWFSDNTMCTYTRGQIGWRDKDSDGLLDLEETSPFSWITSPPRWGKTVADDEIQLMGLAWSPHSKIDYAEYQVNGGAWTRVAAPGDGTWDEHLESIGLDVTLPLQGQNVIKLRTHNADGVLQRGVPDSCVVRRDTQGPPQPYVSAVPNSDPKLWTNAHSVIVSWQKPYDVSGVSGYNYFTDQWPTSPVEHVIHGTAQSMTLLPVGSSHWYAHVAAVDGLGNWSDDAHYGIRIDWTAPTAPVIASSTHTDGVWSNQQNVSLHWRSTDLNSHIRGYARAFDKTAGTVLTTSVLGDTATAVALGDGLQWFHVAPVDSAGNWGPTSHFQLRIGAIQPDPPAPTLQDPAPGQEWYKSTIATFAWNEPASAPGIAGYSVTRVAGRTAQTPDTTVDTAQRTSEHPDLASGWHTFAVRARDQAGNWTGAGSVSVGLDTTSPDSVTALVTSTHSHAIGQLHAVESAQPYVTVSFNLATDAQCGTAGHAVVWDRSATTTVTAANAMATGNVTAFTSPRLGTDHWYAHVGAYDALGNWTGSGATRHLGPIYIDVTPPSPPQGLFATSGSSRVDLSWRRAAGQGIHHFILYRSTDEDLLGVTLSSSLVDTFYADQSVLNGDTYWYRVAAVDSVNLVSGNSAQAVGRPEYVSPGQGTVFAGLGQLVNASNGGVRSDGHGGYTMHGTVTISAGDTLRLGPGAILRSTDRTGTRRLIVQGTLRAIGNAGTPALIEATWPVAGAWGGILMNPPSGNSRFEHAIIRYGVTNVYWHGGDPTVLDCELAYASAVGLDVSVQPFGTGNVQRCSVHDCSGDGLFVFASGLSTTDVSQNTIWANNDGVAWTTSNAGQPPTLVDIHDNTVRNNLDDGIVCGIGGATTLIRNNIVQRNVRGIVFEYEGWMITRPIIRDNEVSANSTAGIYVSQMAQPDLLNNRILFNPNVGVRSTQDAAPRLRDNVIQGSAIGVLIDQSNWFVADLGTAGSPGHNKLDRHTTYVTNATVLAVNAISNYWGAAQANPAAVIAGNVVWNPKWNPPANAAPTITMLAPATPVVTSTVAALQWLANDTNPADTLRVSLFYDTDSMGLNGTGIAGASALDGRLVSTFTWDASKVPAGSYFVYGTISDGKLTAANYAPATVTVLHPHVATAPDTLWTHLRKAQTVDLPLRVRNDGLATVHATLAEDDGAGQDVSWLALSHASFTLAPGDSLTIEATCDASGLADDIYRALVQLHSDDPADSLVTVPVVLGVTSPLIVVSPDTLSFAGGLGDSLRIIVTVTNAGSDTLHVTGLSTPGSPFTAQLLDAGTMAPGDSIRVAVLAHPTARGTQAARLNVLSDDPDRPAAGVGLGLAVTGPALALPEPEHDFGGVALGDTTTWSLALASVGEDTLVVSGLASTAAAFSSASSGGLRLAPDDTALVVVRFAPRAPGATAGGLLVVHEGAAHPDTVAFEGWGRAGSAVFADTLLAFGGVAMGDTATSTVWLHNFGDDSLEVSDAVLDGQFALEEEKAAWNVGVGDSLGFAVRFLPTQAGALAGSLRLATDDAQASSLRLALQGSGLTPGFGCAADTLDFGPVPLGTAREESVVVRNPGAGAVRVSGALQVGAPFTVVAPPLPVTIPAGDSVRVHLRFQPIVAATGVDTLALATPWGFLPAAAVALQGEGVEARPTVVANSKSFGPVRVGRNATWNVLIENFGAASAALQVSAPGAPFSRGGDGAVTVPGHGSKSVPVTFAPTVEGSCTDSLSVRWGDPLTLLSRVHVSGAGVIGRLAAPPAPVVTDVFQADTASAWLSVRNSGTGILQCLLIEDAVVPKQSRPRTLSELKQLPHRGSPRLATALLEAAARLDVDGDAVPCGATAKTADGLIVPNAKGADIPWMAVRDPRDFVCPDSTTRAVLDFASGSLPPEVYDGRLLLLTDDPAADSVQVDVSMRVPRMRYVTHDAGRIRLTVTDGGALGFTDVPQEEVYGVGLQWPPGSPSYLCHGALWVAQAADRVSDASYDYDFAAVTGRALTMTAGEPQRTTCAYSDAGAAHPLGVTVTQNSYAFAASADRDYVILDFALTAATESHDVYVGFYLDADIGDPFADGGGWLPDARCGFMRALTGTDSTRVAIVPLAGATPCAFRLVHNPTYVWPTRNIDHAAAWSFLTSGTFDAAAPSAADWSMVMAFGPLQLSPDRETRLAVAVAAAGSEATLGVTAAAARAQYAQVVTEADDGRAPARFALGMPHPNPFNPTLAVPMDVPVGGGPLRLDVCDVRGRRVRTLWAGIHPAGRHVLLWNGRDDDGRTVASGVYFLRLTASTVTTQRKVMLVR